MFVTSYFGTVIAVKSFSNQYSYSALFLVFQVALWGEQHTSFTIFVNATD